MTSVLARLLCISWPRDTAAELAKLGLAADAADVDVLSVRVDGAPADALAEVCRRRGVHVLAATGGAIIAGAASQLRSLAEELSGDDEQLAAVGREIARLLDNLAAARRPRWVCRGRELPTDRRTLVMGIVNVTPDSFSGDGLAGRIEAAVRQAMAFAEAGADIIDIGGESTRPGSDPVPADEELRRVEPVIKELAGAVDVPISIDTQKPEVAARALELGASIVNDVYGLRAPGMIEVVAEAGAGAVIMHMLGKPKTMQQAPHYEDFMGELHQFFTERIEAAVDGGIDFEAIAIDPGFGFGKTVNHNLEMLRRLREFHSLGRPVLVGTSRKSTIGAVLDKPVDQRIWGTAATCAVAIVNGAHIIRVHDVAEMVDVARMTDAIVSGWDEDASR